MPSPPPELLPPIESGQAVARHYRSGEFLAIEWADFQLTQIASAPRQAQTDLYLAPALIDLQINGYGGIDLQSDESATEASLLRMIGALRRDGCERMLLTQITAGWPALLHRIQRYRSLIQANPALRRAIVGWHIEGPFLSDQPGFSGAHSPAWMTDPTPEKIRELRRVTENDPVLLTLAPERADSIASIVEAVRCGFKVSLGHTNASATQIRAAIEAGATAFTHLGNGCPQQLDRHDNILWRALNEPALTTGLIPDGIHVSPQLFRIFHRLQPFVYWTTDAMAAAGEPPGFYTIGGVQVWVGEDRIVRNPRTQTFAGSALTPIEGVWRGAAMLGIPWQDAWDYFSLRPAEWMGFPTELLPGSPAGFCLLRSGG